MLNEFENCHNPIQNGRLGAFLVTLLLMLQLIFLSKFLALAVYDLKSLIVLKIIVMQLIMTALHPFWWLPTGVSCLTEALVAFFTAF